jgi:UDP-glucose 4-epimerase
VADLFEGRRIVVTGGTGSLGQVLVRRLLAGELGAPARVTVFSRDEAKQYQMRLAFRNLTAATEHLMYGDVERRLHFRIGDVRDIGALASVLREADVVFHTAALKQVPNSEYYPDEAVHTNVLGAENLVQAIEQHGLGVATVIGVSTDKACKPVNVMGMSKALQERVFVAANLRCPRTRFVLVRYGNVLASRGSVLPLFHDQIRAGGPVTITHRDMTRFLLSIDNAVDTIFAACRGAEPGECWVPRVAATRITTLADALIGERMIAKREVGIRPGEKLHEILVSEDEVHRTSLRDGYYVIRPLLPELAGKAVVPAITEEYSSQTDLLDLAATRALLAEHKLRVEDAPDFRGLLG